MKKTYLMIFAAVACLLAITTLAKLQVGIGDVAIIAILM
jgi:hypothetical protein